MSAYVISCVTRVLSETDGDPQRAVPGAAPVGSTLPTGGEDITPPGNQLIETGDGKVPVIDAESFST